jgi:hypothetical protein
MLFWVGMGLHDGNDKHYRLRSTFHTIKAELTFWTDRNK